MKGFLICLSVRTRVAQGNFDGFFFTCGEVGYAGFSFPTDHFTLHSNQFGQKVGRLQKADLLIMGSVFSVIRGAASASERSSFQLMVSGGKEAAGALGEVVSEARRMDAKKTCFFPFCLSILSGSRRTLPQVPHLESF